MYFQSRFACTLFLITVSYSIQYINKEQIHSKILFLHASSYLYDILYKKSRNKMHFQSWFATFHTFFVMTIWHFYVTYQQEPNTFLRFNRVHLLSYRYSIYVMYQQWTYSIQGFAFCTTYLIFCMRYEARRKYISGILSIDISLFFFSGVLCY